jgi:hypothetical protein
MLSILSESIRRDTMAYDQKHLLFKYIHDNIILQLEKNRITGFREVENLYLLISLSLIGREYWLPETKLIRYFDIGVEENGQLFRRDHLSHFSITVLLSYIKSKKRYDRLRLFLEQHVVDKLLFKRAHCPSDAEAMILLLDLIRCPYLSEPTKAAIGALFDLDQTSLPLVSSANEYWFTVWGDKFDLGKELDAKRSREVY